MKLAKFFMALGFSAALSFSSLAQTVSFLGGTLTEDFDSMGATGTTTPNGWYVGNNAAAVNSTTITLSDGSVAVAAAILGFNLGTTDSSERALGLGATSTSRYMEVRIANNSGAALTFFNLRYDGEIWRRGTVTASNTFLNMQYSSDGVNYVNLPELFKFVQPVPNTTVAALDGNLAVNRVTGIGGVFTPAAAVPDGATIYLRWRDHNESNGTDPVLAVDNFIFNTEAEPVAIFITSPANAQTFPQSAVIAVTTTSAGSITNVSFLVDGVEVTNDASAAFTANIPTAGLGLGEHTLQVIASDPGGATTSSEIITFTLTPNDPPTIAITNIYSGVITGTTFLVGSPITIVPTAQDDAGVASVDWYIDGSLYVSRPAAPFTFIYNDSLAGDHTIFGVANDLGGSQATSLSVTITVTNPPASYARLVENGSYWKYFNANAEPSVDGNSFQWYDGFYDDSLWSSGLAELGNGDAADGYPETTMIDLGPAADRFRTIYFRRTFDVNDPGLYQNLVLRLLRDDGAIVYLNSLPIYTNNIPSSATQAVTYATLAAGAGDEGRDYQVVNMDPATLLSPLQPGPNYLAVEVHQSAANSTDLSFDLMLWGESAGAPTLVITSPTNGQTYIAGSDVTVNVSVSTFVTNAVIYLDGTPVASTDVSPYSVVVSNVTGAGAHTLVARGTERLGGMVGTSATITINVIPNTPPTVAITSTFNGANSGGPFLVGQVITNRVTATDDVRLTNLAFYVDGVLHYQNTNFAQVLVNDGLAGTHVFSLVGTDNSGQSATNSVTVLVTNPPVAILVPNGSIWRYNNSSNDLGTAWHAATFDDTGWSSGPGDLGGGNLNENNPERTTLDIGVGTRIPTIYFRKAFNVSNPAAYTNLVLNLLRDDGAVVYLNDVEVFRSNLGAANILFTSLANGAAADDGTRYVSANLSPTALAIGHNVFAVEVHQSSLTSSDLTFDLMLWGQPGSSTGPLLNISYNGANTVTVRWSGEAGFKLQQSSDLGSPANWLDVPGNPATLNITVPVSGPFKFYRLRSTP